MNIQRRSVYTNSPIKNKKILSNEKISERLSLFLVLGITVLLSASIFPKPEEKAYEEVHVPVFNTIDTLCDEYDFMSREEIEKAAMEYIENNRPAYVFPLDGKITSEFAYRTDPITKDRQEYHLGVDISAKNDTLISAYADGVVKHTVTNDADYGIYLIIEHDGFETLYAHCSELLVSTGDVIRAGDDIAVAGSTGRSTGIHLHFEVRVDGHRVDPLLHMEENGVKRFA